MNRVCPTCGNNVNESGECRFCGTHEDKAVGWIGSLFINVTIIGILIAGTVFSIQAFGNPLDLLNNFRRNGLYKVTLASQNLPISRDPIETIALDQIAVLREYFESQQFGALNTILEDIQYLIMDYVLLESKKWDEIIGYWDQFLDLEPDHAQAYLQRAGTHYQRKDFAGSLNDLKAACNLANQEGCTRFEKYKDIWQ